MKIAIIGTGYVGLVTGACLAETGNTVHCVDINEEKIRFLRGGQLPIYEPDLEALFHRNRTEGRLTFTHQLGEGIEAAEIIFLALPTPPNEDGTADLSHILQASREIAPLIKSYKTIVIKSTVPVGTAAQVAKVFKKHSAVAVDVVSNPEFLREGVAVDDFMKPDRIIVGTQSERAQKIMTDLYAPYVRQGNPIIFMDERSSELTKYAANSFLAAKISFMNEIANLCDLLGADIDAVRQGIGTDNRIGRRFLFAGVGYGGSCFPKDVLALAKAAEKNDYDFKILDAVMAVNERQKKLFVEKIKTYYNGNLNAKKIAVWGLAFKPETDDIREAPALSIIHQLLNEGALITAFDPEAMKSAKKALGHTITFASNQYEALDQADALVIVTEWPVFRNPDFAQMERRMNAKVIFDGRNLYDLQKIEDLGYYYASIGRKLIVSHHLTNSG